METEDFDYALPASAIAQAPAERRDAARLLVVERGGPGLADRTFGDLPDLLRPGDCLVVNDSRVVPARVAARDATGRPVELLFVEPAGAGTWRAMVRPGRRCPAGAMLTLREAGGVGFRVSAVDGDGLRTLDPVGDAADVPAVLERWGETPLPPYIERPGGASTADRDRYQTIYARAPGSVAAPTAGLHFTDAGLERLAARGIEVASVTLHVGPATFRPIRAARVEDHRVRPEWAEVPPATARAVAAARTGGRRVVAVGTTTVRTLEGVAAARGEVVPWQGPLGLYIVPGHAWRVVDALVTNFHLPRSSLLVLVAAFAGRERVLAAYRHALAEGYRFYSYGDAMLVA